MLKVKEYYLVKLSCKYLTKQQILKSSQHQEIVLYLATNHVSLAKNNLLHKESSFYYQVDIMKIKWKAVETIYNPTKTILEVVKNIEAVKFCKGINLALTWYNVCMTDRLNCMAFRNISKWVTEGVISKICLTTFLCVKR